MLRAGNLRHRVKIFPKVVTRDQYNAAVDSWPETGPGVISTRAAIKHTGGSKQQVSEERFYSKSKEIKIRYRPGITENMRVQIDGGPERYEITYIDPEGIKETLVLDLEKINL